MIKSKKAVGMWFWIIGAIIAVIFLVWFIVAGSGLFSGATSELGTFFTAVEPVEPPSGIQGRGEPCALSSSCQIGFACIDFECTESFTMDAFRVNPNTMCYETGSGFLSKGVNTNKSCTKYPAGAYFFEINRDKSGEIDKGGDTKKSQKFYLMIHKLTSGFPPEWVDTISPEMQQDKYGVYMTPNIQYKIVSDTNFKFCAWVKDTDCEKKNNKGHVDIRVDKLKEDVEVTG